MRYFLLFLTLVILSSCTDKPSVSTSARSYFIQAFDSIKKYSLRRNQVNIDSVENYYFRQIHDTMPLKYAYHFLREAATAIDRHSDFYRPAIVRQRGLRPDPLYTFRGKMLAARYAYVEIRGCAALDSASAKDYSDSLASLTRNLLANEPAGLIIDLRGNSGGNMYPMLGGLASLLGEGILGYDLFPDGHKEPWYITWHDSEPGRADSLGLLDSVHFVDKKPRMAVLCGPGTASGGEGLLLSFRGANEVLVIGEPTYGVPTSNRMVFMPDSGMINITVSYMTDRNGEYSDGPIAPDLLMQDPQRIFEEAYRWIDKEPGSKHDEY